MKKKFNKGTNIGRSIIERSIKELGCGRSVLADCQGNVICGCQVYDAALKMGKKIVTVETTEDVLVVVKRTDVYPDSTKSLYLQLVDNLSQEKNLRWNAEDLIEQMQENLAFDPRKWNGDGCLVREFDIKDLFKDGIVIANSANAKSRDTITQQPTQASLFDFDF